MARRTRKAAKPLARRSSDELKFNQVTPGGPPVGYLTKAAKKYARESHPLVGADLNRIARAFINAYGGNPAELHDLIDDCRDRDNRFDSACRTRILAIQSRRWEVKPADETDPGADALKPIARDIGRCIREIKGWRSRVGEIADGILRAPSVSEIEWHVNRRNQHAPKRLHWNNPNRVRFSECLDIELVEPGSGTQRGKPLSEYGPDKFVVHAPNAGRAAYIYRRGVLISCLMPALTKRYGYQWLLQAAERFGQPAPTIRLPAGATEATVEKALEALRQLTADWQMVLSEGMELDALPGSTGQVTGEVQARIIELANTSYSIAILGQNLTTEVQGGSRSAAEVHDVVRQDILAADLSELDDTITDQLVEPIARYNWPGSGPFVYETELQPKQPKEITPADVQVGALTLEEIREAWGRPAKPSGPLFVPAQSNPFGGAAPADPLALNATSPPRMSALPSRTTTAPATSPTSTPSTHPLVSALKQKWGGPAQ